MSNRQHSYTEADIRRYLEGGMSRAEMHRFEMAALDDPFLHDAVDGYTAALDTEDPVKIQEIVNDLRKFKPKSGTRKYRNVVIPHWQKNIMQFAVAAMLVGVGGWYIFNIPEKQGVTTAKQEQAVSPSADSTIAKSLIPETVKKEVQPAIISSPKTVPGLAKSRTQPFTVNPLEEEPKPDIRNDETVAKNTETISPSASTSLAASADQQAPVAAANSRSIKGKVTDADDYPLDNINVQVKGSPSATLTDELGRFNLKVPDSNAIIIASAPGYKTKEVSGVSPNEKLEMKLEKSSVSLDEVVVSGYSRMNKTIEVELDTSEAVPSGGWKNFSHYLRDKQELKRSGKKAEIVVLAFEVDKNGRPAEFEILQSAGKLLDNEAIRLLQHGPAWINKTKNPSPLAKVTVIF